MVLSKLDQVKNLIRSVVGSSKELPAHKLQSDYRNIVGEFIPFTALGFPDLHSFVLTIPDVIRVGRNINGEVVYKEVPSEKTAHLAAFTKAVKKCSKSRPKPQMRRLLPNHGGGRGGFRGRGGPRGRGDRGRGGPRGRGGSYAPFGPQNPYNSGPRFLLRAPQPQTRPPMINQFRPRSVIVPPTPVNTRPQFDLRSQIKGSQSQNNHSESSNQRQTQQQRQNDHSESSNQRQTQQSSTTIKTTPRKFPPRSSPTRKSPTRKSPPRKSPPKSAAAEYKAPAVPQKGVFGRTVSRSFNQALDGAINQDVLHSRRSRRPSRRTITLEERDPDSDSLQSLTIQIRQSVSHVTEETAAAAAAMTRMKEDLPPRFARKLAEMSQNEEVQFPVEPDKPETPGGDEEDHRLVNVDIESLTTDYKTILMHYCQRYRSRPQYEIFPMKDRGGDMFACLVKARDGTFGSAGHYPTQKEAELAAARNACETLDLIKKEDRSRGSSPGKSLINGYDEELVRSRVRQILERKSNGLWDTRLEAEYREQFKETPPKDLLGRLEEWNDIVSIETGAGLSDRRILYPCREMSVKLTREGSVTLCRIPDAALPKPGQRIKVTVSHVYDLYHFFVQEVNPRLSNLMQMLQETYGSRGSPNTVVDAEEGTYCVALYTDNMWYRAHIFNIEKEGNEIKYGVFYVDFGNFETVSSNRVRRILDNMCVLPAQAINCCLANCYPPEGEEWEKDSKAMTMLNDVSDLIMEVVSHDLDKGCMVRLFCGEDTESDLASWLIAEHLASGEPIPMEPPKLELQSSSEWDIYVCYINTPTEIVVRYIGPEYSEELIILEDFLGAKAKSSSVKELELGPDELKPNRVYMIKSDEPGEPYNRVRVLYVEETEAMVEYLDHGYEEAVDVACLLKLPARYNQLPYQAIPAKLTGLEPFEGNKKVLDALVELAFAKSFVAQVDDRVDRVSLTLWDTSIDDVDVNINEKVAKVLNIEDLAPKLPNTVDTVEGYVSYVNDCGRLFFQVKGAGLEALEKLTEDMENMYEKESRADHFVAKPEEKMLYACKLEESWYRVEITEVFAQRRVEVFFVDFGFTEVVASSRLRNITHNIEALPRQAIECIQYKMPPGGCEWNERALSRIMELCPSNELRVLEIAKPGEIPQVEVYFVSEEDEHIAISEILNKELHLFRDEEDDEGEENPETVVLSPTSLILKQIEDESQSRENISWADQTDDTNNNIDTEPANSHIKKILDVDLKSIINNLTNGISDRLSQLSVNNAEKQTNSDGDSDYLTPRSSPDRAITNDKEESDISDLEDLVPESYVTNIVPSDARPVHPGDVLTPDGVLIVGDLEGAKPHTPSDTPPHSQSPSHTPSDTPPRSQSPSHTPDSTPPKTSVPSSEQNFSLVTPVMPPSFTVPLDTLSPFTSTPATLPPSLDKASHPPFTVPLETSSPFTSTPSALPPSLDKPPLLSSSFLTSSAASSPTGLASGDQSQEWTADFDSSQAKRFPLPPPLEFPKSGADIFITYVADPSNFWAIRDEQGKTLKLLMQQMQEYYNQDRPQLSLDDIMQKQVYAGLLDGTWYRAVVHGIMTKSGMVKVHFVDYGDMSVLPLHDLRILPVQFRKSPFFAFQCKLQGIKPSNGESTWSRECTERFEELILEKKMLAWIYSETEGMVAHSTILSVSLFDPNAEPTRNTTDNTSTTTGANTKAFIHLILTEENLASK